MGKDTRTQAGPVAVVGRQVIRLDVVRSEAAREKGLGGRIGLADNQGMLFVFDDTNEHCFWMKDMRFSIDMIWLNARGRVEHIEKNVSPDTYPETFCPNKPSKYMLEVVAGMASDLRLRTGSSVALRL